MSLIDRINSRFLAWKRKRRHRMPINISVEDDEVILTADDQRKKTFRLADLTEATVYYYPNYIGSDIVLILGFSDGSFFQITSDDPSWWNVLAALDRSGKIAVPSYKWILKFMAAGDKGSPLDLLALR